MELLQTFVSLTEYEKNSLEWNTLLKLCELLGVSFTDATLTQLLDDSSRRRSNPVTFVANFLETQVTPEAAPAALSGINSTNPLVVQFEDEFGTYDVVPITPWIAECGRGG